MDALTIGGDFPEGAIFHTDRNYRPPAIDGMAIFRQVPFAAVANLRYGGFGWVLGRRGCFKSRNREQNQSYY